MRTAGQGERKGDRKTEGGRKRDRGEKEEEEEERLPPGQLRMLVVSRNHHRAER